MTASSCTQAIDTLFDEDRIASNFSSMAKLFPVKEIPRGDVAASVLPSGNPLLLSPEAEAWITDQHLTSLLFLKNGSLRHQSYHRGTSEADLRMSWSVAKSFLSTLFGILIHDGVFSDIDALASEYAPELKNSIYAEVTLRQLLQMSSGARFDEDYHDPGSDIRKLARRLGRSGGLDEYTLSLTRRHAEPGAAFAYNSIDTHVLGMAIRGATGKTIPELLSQHLIIPLGLETAPAYVTDAHGEAFVLGGLTFTTRDYARFGQMILQNGFWDGQQIVPEAWIREATTPSAPTAANEYGYGYQWWMPADAREGECLACGIYGQYIYLNRTRNVVIVITSANRQFSEDGVFELAVDMCRQLSGQA